MATPLLPHMVPLGALRTFEVAARLLSFKRAAHELGVTPTAVSHQVRLLEEQLGVALFERRVRQVSLTSMGQQLYPAVRDGFDAFARGLAALRPPDARRALTITATMAFTSRWLVPRVNAFRAQEPALDLSFLASDTAVDLSSGVAELAVRYGRPPWPGLTTELLLRDRFVVAASPRLGLRRAADLEHHALIHFAWQVRRADTPRWSLWLSRAKRSERPVGGALSFSDESHAIQAAQAGQGVGLFSLAVIADELARGSLVRPFGPELPGDSYYLAYPPGALRDERIAAARRWLLREARTFSRAQRSQAGEPAKARR